MAVYLLIPAIIVSYVFYVYSVYRCRLRTRVMAKALTSLIFVAIAVVSHYVSGSNKRYFVFMLVALSLCTFGDVFLEISKTDDYGINYFIYSLGFFFAAHVAFCALFCVLTGVYPVDFFATAAFLALLALIGRKLKLDFLNMDSYVLGYAVVISFMFVKSLSLLYGMRIYVAYNVLVALGAGLFFIASISYAILLFGKKRPRPLTTATTGIYYTGQVLLALSVLFTK
ncbi:MAG: lysoplasmalogenase family protein [Hydrogenoanaerobacterium sp.]